MTSPERIGRYTLLSRLGSGGAGEVWEALLVGPVGFKKRVALKLVASSERDVATLRHEARLGALLRHPNLVDVYELGDVGDGRMFLAMELVPGPSLGTLLKRHGPIAGPALREIALQLCRGLAYVHQLQLGDGQVGLVHRDIKPNNILLDPGGMVKIADLGIARLAGARTRHIEGTPGYLSPEQLNGDAPAPPADVFSVGMVLWAMAAGTTPVRGGKTLAQALRTAMNAQSSALRARATLHQALPGLDAVVLRCLDPDPSARFIDGHALREALRELPEPRGDGLFELLASFDASDTVDSADLGGVTVTERTHISTSLRTEHQPLIGRSQELAASERALKENGAVVSLKGLGGIGKTRLAQRLAHRWDRTPQRVAWADVSPVRSDAGLVTVVAAALGVPLGASDAESTLEQALAAQGDLLLVLDRVDHVAAHVAARTIRWRAKAPSVRFLLTARQPLQVPGEVVVELGPLSGDEALQLFVRAAPRALSAEELPTIAKLIRRLDHLPLAIELAAARTNLLAPAELLARLDDRFSILSDGQRGTLSAVIDWSWDQLEPWSQHAMIQLAAFRSTFLVQAAESVVDVSQWPDAPWPLDVIDDLWRRSLLYVRHTSKGPRLGMFESVRAYVIDKVGAASKEARLAAEAHHGEWYARHGTPAALDALHTSAGDERHREMSRELEDLVAAFQRSVASGQPDVAEATGLAAAEVLGRTGPHRRARRVLETLIAMPELQRRDHALRLLLSIDTAMSFDERTSLWAQAFAAAPTHRRQARIEADRARDRASVEPEPAIAQCQAALTTALEAGELMAQTVALTGLGIAQRILGRNDEASVSLSRSYAISKTIGDSEGMANARMSLGNTLHNLGDYAGATAAYQEAERRFRASGHKGAVASALGNQAMVEEACGRGETAKLLAMQSVELGQAIGDTRVVLTAKTKLATAHMLLNDCDGALALYQEVVPVAREREMWRVLTMALSNMAHVLGNLDRHAETIPVLTEAAAIACRLGSPRSEALANGNLGLAHVELGDYVLASAHLDRAVLLATGVDPRFEGGFRAGRARLATLLRQDPSEDLTIAEELLTRVHDTLELAKLTCTKAVWAAQQGRLPQANALLQSVAHTDPDVQRRVREARRQLRGL